MPMKKLPLISKVFHVNKMDFYFKLLFYSYNLFITYTFTKFLYGYSELLSNLREILQWS